MRVLQAMQRTALHGGGQPDWECPVGMVVVVIMVVVVVVVVVVVLVVATHCKGGSFRRQKRARAEVVLFHAKAILSRAPRQGRAESNSRSTRACPGTRRC